MSSEALASSMMTGQHTNLKLQWHVVLQVAEHLNSVTNSNGVLHSTLETSYSKDELLIWGIDCTQYNVLGIYVLLKNACFRFVSPPCGFSEAYCLHPVMLALLIFCRQVKHSLAVFRLDAKSMCFIVHITFGNLRFHQWYLFWCDLKQQNYAIIKGYRIAIVGS